jgi:hypothetical protein
MTRAIQAIVNQANDMLEINSPSGVFEEIGQFAIRGLANALGDTAAVQKSVADLVNELTLPFDAQINDTGTTTAVSTPTPAAGGSSTIINIDARGTDAPTVDRLRNIVREELDRSGQRADVRIRT